MVNGTASRSILKTYQSERRRIAQDLIAFDHKFSRLFSGRPAKDLMDEAGISMDEFKDAFVKGRLFTSGVAIEYGNSVIVAKEGDSQEQGDGSHVGLEAGKGVKSKQELASNVPIGMRMPSFQVLNQADARPWQFQEMLKSDGRWRIVVFAGDVSDAKQMERVAALGKALDGPESFIRRFTPAGKNIDSLIEILTIHSAKRAETEMHSFPDIFHPFDEQVGWDYWKVFVDDESYHEGYGDAYTNYGVGREEGCLVVLRPDQYVAWVGALEDVEAVDQYFSGFMIANNRVASLD